MHFLDCLKDIFENRPLTNSFYSFFLNFLRLSNSTNGGVSTLHR